MITRLACWWIDRKERRKAPPPRHKHVGECICGRQVAGDDLHMIVSVSEDDKRLGIEGSTAVSADFCADHCPGGCELRCPTLTV